MSNSYKEYASKEYVGEYAQPKGDYVLTTNLPEGIPTYTSDDEGKVLRIVSGVPTWVSLSNAEEASF